jgi:hypothetical protein
MLFIIALINKVDVQASMVGIVLAVAGSNAYQAVNQSTGQAVNGKGPVNDANLK